MAGENDTRLGADEMTQLRGRVLAGIHTPRRHVGGIVAGVAAVAAVAVVVAVAWTAAASRPAPVAASPSPTVSEDAPSNPEGLWKSDAVEAAYVYLDPDGTYAGGDGCNAHEGTWSYENRTRSVIALNGAQSLKICLTRDGEEWTTPPPTLDPDEWSQVPTLLIPAQLQAKGDTLRGVNGDGDTVVFHRDPTVEVEAGTILARAEKAEGGGDLAQLTGRLSRTKSGVLGVGETPVVFPAGTRLLEDGDGIEVEGVGVILLGDELSAGGGTTSRQTWGPPLPYRTESFLAWHVTR